MNSYYLNILNQLGYHVINPNQTLPRISMNSMNKEIERYYCDNFLRFADRNFEANYYKDNDSFYFTVDGCTIKTGKNNSDNQTYDVRLSAKGIEISFFIQEMPMENLKSTPGIIHVSVIFPGSNGESVSIDLRIDQHAIYGVNSINDRKGIISNRIEASECTTKNYINWILESINNYSKISKDSTIQKGLKVIVPSLSLAISDMLNYCKTFALTNEIVLRKMNVSSQEENIKIANSIISDEKKEIEELEYQRDLNNGENKIGFKVNKR